MIYDMLRARSLHERLLIHQKLRSRSNSTSMQSEIALLRDLELATRLFQRQRDVNQRCTNRKGAVDRPQERLRESFDRPQLTPHASDQSSEPRLYAAASSYYTLLLIPIRHGKYFIGASATSDDMGHFLRRSHS